MVLKRGLYNLPNPQPMNGSIRFIVNSGWLVFLGSGCGDRIKASIGMQ